MKAFQTYTILLLLAALHSYSQSDSSASKIKKNYTLTVEPGIGISPMPIVDMTLSNIIQFNLTKRTSLISCTTWKENNLFQRNFNYIKGSQNHSISQKFGIGRSLNAKRSIHTLSLLAGIKYDTYRETLDNPKFERVEVRIKSWSPDVGLMYNLKLGKKKFFFSYRMYIPLYPYPFKTTDYTSLDGNFANISFEAGLGIRLN